MFLLGLEFGGQSFAWDSATPICLIVFGLVTLCMFFLNEWKLAKYPIIPLDLFSKRHNIACLAVCACHGFVFIGGSFYLPFYFQTCLGATPILSGVYTLCSALSLSIASMMTGIFIRKTGQYLPPIRFGFAFILIGYALFTNLGLPANWAKVIIYQIVAGIGVGPQFQAPLIALQSNVNPRDIAAATATFTFTRNIATSISVVVGGVVFQNIMNKQRDTIIAALGPKVAGRLSGFSAGANVKLIDSLPAHQREVVRGAFVHSLYYMWIMYAAFAGLGLLCTFLVSRKRLDKQHEQTKTGLDVEKEKRADRVAAKAAKHGPVADAEKVSANEEAPVVR